MQFSVSKSCGWRRRLAVLLVFVMALQLPVVAGAQEKAARLAETITDQANREVSVRFPSERIVCLQHHSLDIITQLGGRKSLVGVVKGWERLLGGYMRDVLPGIEALPTPGDLNDCNVEEVAKLKPDLVIVAVQFDKGKIAQLEKLGIPVLVVALRTWQGEQKEAQSPDLTDPDTAYTLGCKWAVETLGRLTGREKQAEALWAFAMENRRYVEERLSDVPDAQRIRVFIANENNMTYGTGKYVSCQLERAGAVNVAAKELKGYKEVNFERVAKWDPDVIIVQDRNKEVYDEILSSEKWKPLNAVRHGRVYLAPSWTKIWGNPGPDSIALGELWLANRFYPERFDESVLEDKVERFYEEFYGIPFKGAF